MMDTDYDRHLAGTKAFFESIDVHAMPEIFGYWALHHLNPLWSEFGFGDAPGFFSKYLRDSAGRTAREIPAFASIGSGVCSVEIETARRLRDAGLREFTVECHELSPELLERGRTSAIEAGVLEHLRFIESDFNDWQPTGVYDGVMVHHALHHVVNLEILFDRIHASLHEKALFAVMDMIGRNGHQRWPEALVHVHRFWKEMPPAYRWNALLKRYEEVYENWDCSGVAFEGIRAQDVLPELLERFDFEMFLPYGNVIDVFVDRCFGHNFRSSREWDRAFIDRVNAFDEAAIVGGSLTPTQMVGVLTSGKAVDPQYSRGLAPQRCVRHPGGQL